MRLCNSAAVTAAGTVALALAPVAGAAVNTIDWLQMAPTPFGSPVPNGSIYNLPGLGNVTVTYSISSDFAQARVNNPLLSSGSIVSGTDTYNWSNHEIIGATLLTGPDPLVPVPWSVTFSWSNPVAANSIYVGVSGLGRTTSFGGGASPPARQGPGARQRRAREQNRCSRRRRHRGCARSSP
jgi:hypothetical protein